MSQLIISMGKTSYLIAEVVGFFNYEQYPLYYNHKSFETLKETREKNQLEPINTISMICTNDSFTSNKQAVEDWLKAQHLNIDLQFHILNQLKDISSAEDARIMRNLIYSLVYNCYKQGNSNKLYLCLSGGRKTMSSDIQQAAYLFGCKAMIHILAEGDVSFNLSAAPEDIEPAVINKINPVLYQKDIPASKLAELIEEEKVYFPEPKIKGNEYIYSDSETKFLNQVEELQTKQDNLTINYYTKLRYSEPSSNFQILHLLNPKKIQELKNNYINGIDNIKQDLNWLYKLPKTDLHCHLGGFADTEGLIKIAIANLKYSGNTLEEKKLERSTINAIQKNDLNKLKAIWKTISTRENKVRWLLVSLYLRCFEGKEKLLEQVIWNNLLQEDNFVDIGLENYEEIGDFQGSSLLQTEEALREICHQLKDDAKKNNLRYKELRCSPCNYTNKLKATEVVEILYDELIDEECVFRLIIIGSRHKSQRILKEHIDLCKNIKRENGKISDFICGFDLAGPEEKTTLSLREKILPLLEDCIRITIHSGETTSVKNIWEAVYNLNADRIGHGLYLQDDENLMLKLKENKTAIELCPSSNFQINSYRDYSINSTSKMRIYPLKQYLQKGIKACICSDDPGISRTDISKEYLKAAKMTKGGLSKWNILTIIRNGFVGSFQTRENKQKLISEAEKDIMKLV